MKTFLACWTPDWLQHAAGWIWAQARRARGKFVAANPDANDVYPDDIADQPPQMARDLAEIEASWLLPARTPSHEQDKQT